MFAYEATKVLQRTQRDVLFRESLGVFASLKKPSARVVLFVCNRFGGSARIPLSQFQLYMDERRSIRQEYDLEPWFVFDDQLHQLPEAVLKQTVLVCLQAHYNITTEQYRALTDRLLLHAPSAKIAHFDLAAPADLRQAARVNDRVSVYVKKHLLVDRRRYGKETIGMTNLSDFFARDFGIERDVSCFPIPDGFFEKLEIGPTFFTEYAMQRAFRHGSPDRWPRDRSIDVHARFGTEGLDWYAAMRTQARAAAKKIKAATVLTDFPVSRRQFMNEMVQSKICFSPFGYGEVCWRDFEALSVGALLIKPDVSHIELASPLMVAGESYVPLRWDSSDLPEKIEYFLKNEAEREEIARNGFLKIKAYFDERQYQPHFDRLFRQISLN